MTKTLTENENFLYKFDWFLQALNDIFNWVLKAFLQQPRKLASLVCRTKQKPKNEKYRVEFYVFFISPRNINKLKKKKKSQKNKKK